MRWRTALFATIALSPLLAAGVWADTVLRDDSRTTLTLTIAQDGAALVHDRRTATLEAGEQSLIIEPVARQARLEAGGLTGPGISVRSQSLDLDGIDAQTLLAAHRGKEVTIVWRTGSGAEREERAIVLSADGVPVFGVDGKVISGQPERLVYDSLPAGLHAVPVYRADIAADKAGKRTVELAYVTHGLSWQPAYVIELEEGGKALLSSWATLDNQSGGDFPAAQVRLLAGDPHRGAGPTPMPRAARMEKAMMATAPDNAPSREALGPHHLYTLAPPVSLRDGQSTQVPLLPPVRITAERQLELPPLPPHAWVGRFATETQPQHPDTLLALRNGSGQPLPAGPARLFLRGADGGLALAGDDRMPMVPVGAPFRLSLGKAFDVTARRVQTDSQKVAAEISETAWEVKLANAGANPVKVLVREVFAGEWLVLEESQRHDKTDAHQAGWSVQVPAKGETVLRYRVRIKL